MPNSIPAKKSLGQNFLTCPWAVSAIINAANLSSSDTVLEIGPGTGILTRPLAARVKKVIAIEKDERLAQTLDRQLKSEQITNVDMWEGDILTYIPPLPASYKIVANIPYYLTTRLFRLFLDEQQHKPDSMVLTIQKEVAEHVIAQPPAENILALSVQVFAMPVIISIIPASCFSPKPRVDSAIISISDISDSFFTSHNIEKDALFRLLHLAFAQKRKMLTNTMSHIASKKDIESALCTIGASPRARPQELSKEQWALLTNILKKVL